ncbi:TPR-like protein [Dendrothele bispora CBS 962.96]|uniref:TPR-like protein n=1 Tax=Dendrothele bispora (strain CBS 962.96) TaxID=1314807 RepID=A0A4S8MVJ3_DENBC|nr:TPR-like protein [Dendrothele bispora CBS 962.96]
MSSIEDKLATGKQHKDTADQAFKTGDTKTALASYHTALMYLQGLDKNAMKSLGLPGSVPPKDGGLNEKTEVDEIVEKIYANMSACHIKNGNWKRAQETAEKALAKNDKNYKAMYRKAKALAEQRFFEKAEKIYLELKEKNPSDAAAVDQDLSHYRAIDQQLEKANRQKLKGFLNKKPGGMTIEEKLSEAKSTDP